MLIAFLAEKLGHVWNVHGDAIGMMLLFFGSLLFAFVFSLITLSSVIPTFRRYPEARTKVNVFCAAFASLYVVASTLLVTYIAFSLDNT